MKKFKLFKKKVDLAKKNKNPYIRIGVKELELILIEMENMEENLKSAEDLIKTLKNIKPPKPKPRTIQVDGAGF